MNCPHCNAMNAAKSTTCWSCGRLMSAAPPKKPQPAQRPSVSKSPQPSAESQDNPKNPAWNGISSAILRAVIAFTLVGIYFKLSDIYKMLEDIYHRMGEMCVYRRY